VRPGSVAELGLLDEVAIPAAEVAGVAGGRRNRLREGVLELEHQRDEENAGEREGNICPLPKGAALHLNLLAD
jgi:hypothetical protein